MIHICPAPQNIYAKVYPDWTCEAPTPNHGGTLQHLRGSNPWPRILLATLQPTVPSGAQPFSVAQINKDSFILFGYISESLDAVANLQIDDKDSPPNVESVGGVSKDIFLFNLPAWLF